MGHVVLVLDDLHEYLRFQAIPKINEIYQDFFLKRKNLYIVFFFIYSRKCITVTDTKYCSIDG